ncbi:hypothetical protein J6590_039254 [Homalodisca vitripennis]|nr:hypothetical protein J6590_039254 [Homalodisca vitripennis]
MIKGSRAVYSCFTAGQANRSGKVGLRCKQSGHVQSVGNWINEEMAEIDFANKSHLDKEKRRIKKKNAVKEYKQAESEAELSRRKRITYSTSSEDECPGPCESTGASVQSSEHHIQLTPTKRLSCGWNEAPGLERLVSYFKTTGSMSCPTVALAHVVHAAILIPTTPPPAPGTITQTQFMVALPSLPPTHITQPA